MKLSSREKRNLCNYIMVLWLLHLQKNKPVKTFTKLNCVEELRDKLILPLNILYYGYIYQPEELKSNAEIQIFFRKTRDYMIKMVDNYLNNNNNPRLLGEINNGIYNITLNPGNMPRSMSQSYFDILYKDLPKMQINNYYSNNLNLLKHRTHLELLNINRTHFIGNIWENEDISVPIYEKQNSKMLILPFIDLQPPIYHHSFHSVFKWSTLGYLLAKGLHSSFYDYAQETFYFLYQSFSVDVAYQAYMAEQKDQLQPDFTDMSWKKLFFLNSAQFYCIANDSDFVQRSIFHGYFPSSLESFNDAFHCNDPE